MATEIGSSDAPLKDRHPGLDDALFRKGYQFEFFQAVRLLERLYPDAKPVGRHDTPKGEVVRFRTRVSSAFPPSEIYDIVASDPADESSPPVTMWVNFMGLAGAMGVLPPHYTQLLTDPALKRETAGLRDFLDVFNHRLISLFYRAWEKYRFPIVYERQDPEGDSFSRHLYSLIGLGTDGLRGRHGISDEILLYYAGHLSRRPRAATALEGMLQDYFNVPVALEQFTGEWFLMNEDALTRLGPDGTNNQLGITTVLWERLWDPQARFRIRLGPLTYEQFQDFLPPHKAYRDLVEMTRFFVGEEFRFDVLPVLQPDEVPMCSLHGASRLGWNMWLKTEPFTEPTTQPVFAGLVGRRPDAAAAV